MKWAAYVAVAGMLAVSLRADRAPKSPEVAPDGAVTFRVRAPGAAHVLLDREAAKGPLPMVRGTDGVWTVTTPPLEPDYYGYSFRIDGVAFVDPQNSVVKPSLLWLSSMVHVPGPKSLPWEVNDVPHGEVSHHRYRSGILGLERDYYVYTPPGYEREPDRRYPTLYLLHGYGDDASAWTAVGRADVILDNLLARGLARPMIVVMPLGYGRPGIADRYSGESLDDPALRAVNSHVFRAELLSEIMPQIAKEYRVLRGRDSRALAGSSMGGAESLRIGLNDLADFAWIGSFSTGRLNGFETSFPQAGPADNGRIRLLWMSCGEDDPFIAAHRNLDAWFTRKGLRHTAQATPGAHTWQVWRRNLAAFAPLLFSSPP